MKYRFNKPYIRIGDEVTFAFNVGIIIGDDQLSPIEIKELLTYGYIESVPDSPDWRERYESFGWASTRWQSGEATKFQKETFKKLDAYLKILCYVEWANEGKDRKTRYSIFSEKDRLFVYEHLDRRNDIVELRDRQDAENMLTDTELVEALNVVFNVK